MTPHEYLNSFTNFETRLHKLNTKEFDLSRVVELLGYLGDPHKKLKVIHVAGTKGKGSTCAFISHILAAGGLKVGLYTSPHLHKVNERIRMLDQAAFNGKGDFHGCISDEQLAQVINDLRPHIAAMINRGLFLTYFEVLTVAAFTFFSRQNLDWVVLETGLGGRLDATNVTESLVAVLTPMSFDHASILGKTLEEIAAEKAGIIKSSRQKVVIAPQRPQVMEVLSRRCREFGIVPVLVEPSPAQELKISLKGDHQKVNALTAVRAVALLEGWGCQVTPEAVTKGLKRTRWPGRFEILNGPARGELGAGPLIIADGAHNEASARALAKTIADEYLERKVVFVLGFSTDKDIAAIVRELKSVASVMILTKADHPRAHAFTVQEAGALLTDKISFMVDNVAGALNLALSKASKNDMIVVAGSLFVVAEARTWAASIHVPTPIH